jgi:hypothetical protein
VDAGGRGAFLSGPLRQGQSRRHPVPPDCPRGRAEKTYLGNVTAYEKPRLLGIRLGDGKLRLDVKYRLTPMGTGTPVDCQMKMSAGDWIGRTLGLVARPITERVVGRHMDNLKCLAEDAAAGLELETDNAIA